MRRRRIAFGLAPLLGVLLVLGAARWLAGPSEEVPPPSPHAAGVERASAPLLRGRPPDAPRPAPVAKETAGSVPQASPPTAPTPTGPEARPLVRLDGRVRVGARPVPDAVVLLPDTSTGPGTVLPVDEEGRFSLAAREAIPVRLRVSTPGRQPRTVTGMGGGLVGGGVDVVFGTGCIYGVVRDEDGVPVDDVPVRCSTWLTVGEHGYAPSAEGSVFDVEVRTEAGGAYEFRDLPVGSYIVVARPAQDRRDPRNMRSFRIRLAEGEQRRLDVGDPLYDPLWTGNVRYEDGPPVWATGSILLKSEDGERRLYVSFDEEGHYSQAVPAGTYRMEFVFPGPTPGTGMRLVATDARLEVPAGGTLEDAIVPGGRVRGRIEPWPEGEGTDRPVRLVRFMLMEAEAPRTDSLITGRTVDRMDVAVGEGGAFLADGLAPGRWIVTTVPNATEPRELVVRGVAETPLRLERKGD